MTAPADVGYHAIRKSPLALGEIAFWFWRWPARFCFRPATSS